MGITVQKWIPGQKAVQPRQNTLKMAKKSSFCSGGGGGQGGGLAATYFLVIDHSNFINSIKKVFRSQRVVSEHKMPS